MKAARTSAAVASRVARSAGRSRPGVRPRAAAARSPAGGSSSVAAADQDAQHALHGPPQPVRADQHRRLGRRQRADRGQVRAAPPACSGRRGATPVASCSAWAMNSTSMPPPGRSFTSHGPVGGSSRSSRAAHAGRVGPRLRRVLRVRQRLGDGALGPRAGSPGRPPPPAPGSAPCAPRSRRRCAW